MDLSAPSTKMQESLNIGRCASRFDLDVYELPKGDTDMIGMSEEAGRSIYRLFLIYCSVALRKVIDDCLRMIILTAILPWRVLVPITKKFDQTGCNNSLDSHYRLVFGSAERIE